MEEVKNLGEKLHVELEKIFAVDAVIYKMLKVVKGYSTIIAYCGDALTQEQYDYVIPKLETLKIFFTNALDYLQYLFGSNV